MKNTVFLICSMLISLSAFSQGYSDWAIPTHVELVNDGVVVHGAFGDPNSCGVTGVIFIASNDTRHDAILSMALAALMGKRDMRFYSASCAPVSFHWSGNSVSKSQVGHPVYIR